MNPMITILIVMCFLTEFIAFTNSDICRIEECDASKIGPHCEIVCPYPWFGKQCLSKCNCSRDHCDPADGCIGWTTQDSLAGHTATSSRSEDFNDITWNVNTSRHQKKPADNKNEIDGFLIYFILSPLVVAFILCLLYVRLVFLCRFEHS